MTNLSIAHQYFEAWNKRDAQAIKSLFIAEGTYQDPVVGLINIQSIDAYTKNLWEAFPNLSFSILTADEIGTDKVAAQWMMSGNNTGPFMGLPPTSKKIVVLGADFIEFQKGKIKSITGYFDSKATPSQLGLQISIQPHQLGPFTFGTSIALESGNKAIPGAFSITSIWNSETDSQEIRAMSSNVAKEMTKMEGFIGFAAIRIAGRGVTISAWEKPENINAIMQSNSHIEAVKRFWSDLSDAAYTSVWIPDHVNALWVRCTTCRKMQESEKSYGRCDCGVALPTPPTYF